MMGSVAGSGGRHRLWRSRWAAIGAAVAVTFGGSGAFWAHADGAESQPTLETFVEMRQTTPRPGGEEPAKTASPFGGANSSPEALGPDIAALTGGATFTPITPYRAYDSRVYTDGLMLWGDEVYFDVLTDLGGNLRIPATAVAVTYNLTITGTFGGGGYLALFPPPGNWPGNSSINWWASGLDLANGGVVQLGFEDGPGQVVVSCGNVPNTATDFIIDITGYYE